MSGLSYFTNVLAKLGHMGLLHCCKDVKLKNEFIKDILLKEQNSQESAQKCFLQLFL